MRRPRVIRRMLWCATLAAAIPLTLSSATENLPAARLVFLIRVDPKLDQTIEQGRLFVFISRAPEGTPRLFDTSVYINNAPNPDTPVPILLGKDVMDVSSSHPTYLGAEARSYPLATLRTLPAGDYAVQAVLTPYTRFKREDGSVIWAHQDQGEGQDVLNSPGNLVSGVVHAHLDVHAGFTVNLTLDHRLPALAPEPADTQFVRRLHFTSERASRFWGQEMRVGVTVTLPQGYEAHPDRRYPVVFHQGHFNEGAVFSVMSPPAALEGERLQAWAADTKGFREDWSAGRVPQMIVVTLQHPTPYYDTSYFMNSPNTGPWADVFVEEVMPFVDTHFRTIAKPYARVLAGLSSGGGTAAYLQVHFPKLFGGAWIFAPDPVDFRDFYMVNLYDDPTAYFAPGYEWGMAPLRCELRTTQGQCWQNMRDLTRYFDVLGSHGRSGQWLDNYDAMYGPRGDDGYPVPVWQHGSGRIDRKVVAYWRDHGAELRAYLEENWASLAPELKDKLHFAAGEMDNYFLNNGLYLMQEFLDHAPPPAIGASFKYGRPKIGHTYIGVGYDPFPKALLEDMATQIAQHAPDEDKPLSWQQP